MHSRSLRHPLAAVLLLLAACGGDPEPAAAPPPMPDLLAVAERLRAGDNPYFGQAPLRALEAERAQLAPDAHVRRVDLDVQLMWQHLRLGNAEEATAAIERARSAAATLPQFRAQLPQLDYWRGLAWLRRAEIRNCIDRHDHDCCIWPLQGGGIHREAEPAERALGAFLDHLQAQPHELGVRWLANVAALAAARHPDALPLPLQIALPDVTAPGIPRFVDHAPRLGIAALDLCGGAVVADLDRDGFLDLVSSTSDPFGPMRCFRNRGDGTFADVGHESRLARQLGGLNCVQADYDNDGDVDLLVLRGAWLMDDGQIRNSLLRNDGHGRFEDVTAAAGLAMPERPTQAAVWADFDGDGDLDLYIGNESRRELREPPGGDYPSQLFRNDGDGRFTDVAAEAGVTNDRYCKAVAAGDYDDDGDLDLYVSNVGPNRLYRNDGGMRFTDVAAELGVTEPSGRSFACWFFDYDQDGRLDLFVAGYQATLAEVVGDLLRSNGATAPPTGGETLRMYRNLGGRFTDVTREVGLARVSLPMGANFGDIDGDGWLDIYLGTGEPGYEMLIPNLLLRNDGGQRFVDVTYAAGLGHLQKGHGIAFADLDHDGDQDLFHQLGGFYPGDRYYNALYVNPGTGNHQLVVELRGTRSNRDAVGARLQLELDTPDGPRTLHRCAGAVSSFGGSTLRQEIGLGNARAIRRLQIRWPSGVVQQFTDVPLDAWVEAIEGTPELRRLQRPRIRF